MTNYTFVLDAGGKPLAPTKENKAWFLIRKGRATLVCRYPMVIQLRKVVPDNEICKDETRCGIDDGGIHVGISLVQKCQTRNKVVFKGTIEQRCDVKYLMELRRDYRHYHRYHKRYREARFHNRSSTRKKSRIAPSILQKRQATIRVVWSLRKWINITNYWLEDVSIDIRALTDGYKLYKWQYQKSNRLDENIRKAVILRDGCKCMECGKSNCKLEVHHIKPRRLNGATTLSNLISLCEKCHKKTIGNEEMYMKKYFILIHSSGSVNTHYAQHVMIGKNWLRKQLYSLGTLHLTNGGDTANKRIDWDIEKSHANDAICITNLQPDTCSIKEYVIKPMRRQSKARTDNVLGIRHRDLVEYTFKDGKTYRGYVTALYPELKALNFRSKTKHCKKVRAKKCRLLWRYSKIYWFESTG